MSIEFDTAITLQQQRDRLAHLVPDINTPTTPLHEHADQLMPPPEGFMRQVHVVAEPTVAPVLQEPPLSRQMLQEVLDETPVLETVIETVPETSATAVADESDTAVSTPPSFKLGIPTFSKEVSPRQTYRISGTTTTETMLKRSRAQNPELVAFLNQLHADRDIAMTIALSVVALGNVAVFGGLWLEGGASPEEGRVLLATGPAGEPLDIVTVAIGRKVVNGRNALVPVRSGDCIILGGSNFDTYRMAIYRIDRCDRVTDTVYASLIYSHVATDTLRASATTVQLDMAMVSELHAGGFDTFIPAMQEAYRQMHMLDSRVPVHVRCFKDTRVAIAKCNQLIEQQSTRDGYREYATYAEMAEAVTEHAQRRVWNLRKPEISVVCTYSRIVDGGIAIYMVADTYDVVHKRFMHDKPFFAGSLLEPGMSFHYLGDDETNALAYDTIYDALREADDNTMFFTQRCCVPYGNDPKEGQL